MHNLLFKSLKNAWSSTNFASEELDSYAQRLTSNDVRNGLMGLSLMLLCLFAVESYLFSHSVLGLSAVYTCLLLALLSLHILLSARAIREVRSLYLLGTVLLIISGTAFVLMAHNSGSFDFALFASVTLLFMVVPIVPWGLKEASLVLALIYITFTFSTWSSSKHFDPQTLWALQFIMLGAGTISLALVMRNTCLRKEDIRTRFELEQANHRMMQLSNRDPLTGAWNRRFLNRVFDEKMAEWSAEGLQWHFAFLDLDDFKLMNDTCGHEYGDMALRGINDSFSEIIGEHGYVIRMGGDEFALFFTADDPEMLLADGIERVRAFVEASESNCKIGIKMSIGLVSGRPDMKMSQEVVYRSADAALYKAKERKHFFDGVANVVKSSIKNAA